MSQPGPSRPPRPTVQDDLDDDDLDDLDDVLASFNTLAVSKPESTPVAPAPSARPAPAAAPIPETDADFEASLMEGMETLLQQLAGNHPPGPMPDRTTSAAGPSGAPKAGEGQLSQEDEEKAWQKAMEMMLSEEGLAALGLDEEGRKPQGPGGAAKPPAENGAGAGKTPDFEETIRRTMEQLQNPSSGARGAGGAGGGGMGENADLAELLKKLGQDPSALDGLDGLAGEGDDELGGLLDGMMAQLMSREVLEEPMTELASKYPAYLSSPPSSLPPADLEKYRKQHVLVDQILVVFRKPGYSDERDGKEIARLVGEMQDLGGPPKEIMGDLPEGFDLGALGGDENCSIM